MADAGSQSPFRMHSDDTTPIQRNVTYDYIMRIREAMRRVMEELEMPPSEPHSGAVRAAAINLMFCSISLNGANTSTPRSLTPRRRKLQLRCLILTIRMRDQFLPKRSLPCWPNL